MFRSEITDLIEDEIISRYFYESGAIEWTIKKDEQILKALEILNNKEEYDSILKGKTGSILVTRKNDQNKGKSVYSKQIKYRNLFNRKYFVSTHESHHQKSLFSKPVVSL